MKRWILLFLFLKTAHLTLSVNEKKILPTFDEIYEKGWDENDHEKIKVETSPLNSLNEQADHDDNIDQDVEAYNSDSTDQNLTQEDPDRIDQSDDETIEGINDENEFSEQEKREIISKFHALRKEYNGKFPATERVKIERKIGKDLGVNREKIYKWKKEFGLIRKTKRNKSFYVKKKSEFNARIDDTKICRPGEQNKLAKDLGISDETFCRWKKELGLSVNSQLILNQNSVDEHSLPENGSSFADNDTSEHSVPRRMIICGPGIWQRKKEQKELKWNIPERNKDIVQPFANYYFGG